MKTLATVFILLTVYLTETEACSCLTPFPNRQATLRDGVCRGDVYIANVSGVTCNCLPDGGDQGNISCYDYRLQSPGSMLITTELINRAQCYNDNVFYSVSTCSQVATGITPEGYTRQVPEISVNVTVKNTTLPSGSCYLSCPFNDVGNDINSVQPCYYEVTILEVIKGNYSMVGETVMRSGPDVLTSCGNSGAILKLNERYVIGVGGACSSISEWSTLDSYSPSEIQQLRDLAGQFQSGLLKCGTCGLLPSLTLLLTATAIALYQPAVLMAWT